MGSERLTKEVWEAAVKAFVGPRIVGGMMLGDTGPSLQLRRAVVAALDAYALSGAGSPPGEDGTVDQSQYQELQWRRIKMQEMAEEIAALRPTPPEGGRAPQPCKWCAQGVEREDDRHYLGLGSWEPCAALRSRAEPEGENEGRTFAVEPLEDARWLVERLTRERESAHSLAMLSLQSGRYRDDPEYRDAVDDVLLWSKPDWLRVPRARPDGGRITEAVKMVEACAKGLRSILPAADSEALDSHIAELRAALRDGARP
jgi:hypothetical protein